MNRILSGLLVGWASMLSLAFAQPAPFYIVTTIAGSGRVAYPGDGRNATSVNLFEPARVAFDSAGNLYFTETYYQRVFRVSTTGVLTTVAGSGVTGFSGDGGPATAAQLENPQGLAVDAAGNIYVGVTERIRRISPDGTIRTIAGTGVDGYSGDGGPATAAQIHDPAAICVDASNNIYFSDSVNHVVRKISADGRISTVAGTGRPGFSGDGDPGQSAQLNNPIGLAVDAGGNLYIADSANQRIRRLRGGVITTYAGNGEYGYTGDGKPATSASLFNPFGLAVDSAGNLLIGDLTNGCIRRVEPNGLIYTAGRLTGVSDIAFSPAGDFAVVDFIGRSIRRMQPNGSLTFLAGFIRTSAIGDGGPATSAGLLVPRGVSVDGAGNVYVADMNDHRVRRIRPDGVITTLAGTGILGNAGDGGPATEAQLAQPDGLAADAGGTVFVGSNWRIRRIQTTGNATTIASIAGADDVGYSGDNGLATNARIHFPEGLALDSIGNLYIADTQNHRVRRIDHAGAITTIAGNGQQGYFGNGVTATSARLDNPTGVAVDTPGYVYVADQNNHRVRKVSPEGLITDFAGNGELGSRGDGGPATQAQLIFPRSVAVDRAGNVFITSNGLVRRVSADGIITTVAGNGSFTYSGDGDLATLAGMGPVAIAVDGAGRIYLSDGVSYRVRRLDAAQIFPSGVVNAATFQRGPVAPGEMITIFGAELGPAELVRGAFEAGGTLAKLVAETQITFDGIPAPLLYVSANQASAIVPYALAGKSSTVLQVSYRNKKTNAITLPVAESSPGIFTAAVSGSGQGAILNQDWSLNSAANPAAPGSIVMLYATGEGLTAPAGVDGKLAAEVYPKPVLPVSVSIGGLDGEVLYAGAAPGQVAGALQVNVRVPVTVAVGDAAPIRLKVGNNTSPEGVTVAVR